MNTQGQTSRHAEAAIDHAGERGAEKVKVQQVTTPRTQNEKLEAAVAGHGGVGVFPWSRTPGFQPPRAG